MKQQITETACRLIDQSGTGEIDGLDVMNELGIDRNDPAQYGVFYHAFRAAERSGSLSAYFPGGMEPPHLVRR
jgi:hypothetical protein